MNLSIQKLKSLKAVTILLTNVSPALRITPGRGPQTPGSNAWWSEWSWYDNNRNKVHNKWNTLESSTNPSSPYPQSMEKLSSMKPVPGAKKVGGHCPGGLVQTQRAGLSPSFSVSGLGVGSGNGRWGWAIINPFLSPQTPPRVSCWGPSQCFCSPSWWWWASWVSMDVRAFAIHFLYTFQKHVKLRQERFQTYRQLCGGQSK